MATMMVGWLYLSKIFVSLCECVFVEAAESKHNCMYKCQNHKVQKSFNGDVYRDGMHQS